MQYVFPFLFLFFIFILVDMGCQAVMKVSITHMLSLRFRRKKISWILT